MLKARLLLTVLGLLACYTGLGYRLFHLQVSGHGRYSALAQRSQSVRVDRTSPPRGNIYDRNGSPLSVNRHTYSVGYNSSGSPITRELENALVKSLGLDLHSLRQRANSGRFAWIARHAEPSEVEGLRKFSRDGLVLIKENHRYYPASPLAAHVIGCVGMDNQGLSGIEFNFDHQLRRPAGQERSIRDARGRIIYSASRETEADHQRDIYLTIDSGLQHIVERALERGYRKFRPGWAMAVIQRPSTGEILAMATYPGFDANSDVPSADILTNPVVSSVFEPGSTFKIVTAAAALEENLSSPDEMIYCEGGVYEVGGFPIRDFEPHFDMSFTDIMVRSSNIGMAKLGERLGRNLMYKYARDFGFGNFTGIRLPGETRGILRKPDSWSGTSLSRISFGQEIGVTAVQLAGAVSAIANGGVLYEPQIVRKIVSDGKERFFEPLMIRRVISSENAGKVASTMREAVERGSGAQAQVLGYEVAGKTGTAQKFNQETQSYSVGKYVALFGGFVPVQDPELTILVVFDEPHESLYWGGYVAAPVFAEIAAGALSYLNIPPARRVVAGLK